MVEPTGPAFGRPDDKLRDIDRGHHDLQLMSIATLRPSGDFRAPQRKWRRTTADREELVGLGQEAKIHVVVGFDRPSRPIAQVAVGKTAHARNVVDGPASAALGERIVVPELPIDQRGYVEVALVRKVEGK